MGKKKYLEDFKVGETLELGSCHVTRDEILEFARRYDPQPFHVDEAAAQRSIYGGLIASGWHTTAMLMRLLVDGMAGVEGMGSPGADEIRWLKPVRPGDTLTARAVVLDVVPSRSKLDRGHIRASYGVFNQKGEKVMTMISRGIYARRPESHETTRGTEVGSHGER
jgi:acyl dehydratase